MLCDAVPDAFKGLIFDCDGTLVEIPDAPVQVFQDAPRLFGLYGSAERCQSEYGQPNCFIEAARRLSVSAANCVVFEDSRDGLARARRAGVRTVRVQHTPGAMAGLPPFAGLRPPA